MKEFNDAVLGGYNLGQFAGLLFWALIGAYILIQFNANTRDPKAARTPVKFSWSFWIRDNARRAIFNLVLILTSIRFSQEITGKPINEFWALVIGLSSDLLAQALNKFRLVNLIGTTSKNVDDIRKDNTSSSNGQSLP